MNREQRRQAERIARRGARSTPQRESERNITHSLVAQALACCVRRADEMAARYGGEEFVLLLPGTSLEAARAVAQLCLDGIEALALPHAGSCTASALTVSIGVASMLPVAGADPSMLVDAADAALYRAKKEGRNQFGLQPEAAA